MAALTYPMALAFALAVIPQSVVRAAEPPCPSEECQPIPCCADETRGWTATADAIFWRRSPPGSQLLLFEPRTETDLLNASDLGFSVNAGPRLRLAKDFGTGWGMELVYAGIDGWSSESVFPGSSLPFGVGYLSIDRTVQVPVNSADFLYRSRFYSAELNASGRSNDWLQPLIGLRGIDFEDRYEASGIENAYSGPFSHAIRSHNRLYGAQVGLDVRPLDPARSFQIDLMTKAGIYGNAMAQTNEYADTAFAYSASGRDTHVAFLGEIDLTASFQVSRHVALRGGYQVMWLTGVALAPDQISATDFAQATGVSNSATLFCHGAAAGLELTW